jgi:hypothetical protein
VLDGVKGQEGREGRFEPYLVLYLKTLVVLTALDFLFLGILAAVVDMSRGVVMTAVSSTAGLLVADALVPRS